MEKTVFIFNGRQYLTTLGATKDIEIKDDAGKVRIVKQKVLEKAFPVFVKSPDTGSVIHTGYTLLTQEEFSTMLNGSKVFASYIKSGQFKKFDEAPPEALLDTEIIDRLGEENVELKAKVAQLEGLLASAGDSDKVKVIEDLEAELSDIKAKALTLESENDDLKTNITLLEANAGDAELPESEEPAPEAKGLF